MPHLSLTFNPQEMTETEIDAMAEDLCAVLIRHLNIDEAAISLALTRVSAANWKAEVYDPIILPSLARLYKKPGYSL